MVEALSAPGALILAGERLASAPGALTAATALAAKTGAKLAWIPRRAGELGAIDAGALPTLLPGGRAVNDDAARVEVERVWGATVPAIAGRSADQILAAASTGALSALVVGGVDPGDFADPRAALMALSNTGFVVSLEIRASAVTERADVVLPVAPPAEKAGRFVDWEGRRRPFDLTLTSTGALTDGRVLDSLAAELDVFLGVASVAAVRDELTRLGTGSTRPSAPSVAAGDRASAAGRIGRARHLGRAARRRAGCPTATRTWPRTAKPARALLSAATAAANGISAGDSIRVATAAGSIEVPVVLADVLDGVVWLPTNARGCAVRSSLGVTAGAAVTISRGGLS